MKPAPRASFPPAQDATKAVDYIRGWRELQLVRRTVDEEVFQKQNVDVLIAPTVRHGIPTDRRRVGHHARRRRRWPRRRRRRSGASRSGGRANPRGRGPTHARAPIPKRIRVPSTATACRPSRMPCGFSKDGMPIGLQISGPRFGEVNVLALAHAYKEATEWHKRQPPLQPDTKVPVLSKAASEQTGG